jgi:GNAT superfamily N-acetyltransferase
MLQDYEAVIQSQQVIVAEVAGKLAGVLVLSATDAEFLVDNVAVAPVWKSKGIGKALLIRAEHEARRQGYRSIYLYTNEKMIENIALYARAGYVEYERRREQGFCRVFMRKRVEP